MVIGQLKDILVHLQLKKMIHEWRKLEEKLQKLEKNKHSFRMHIADWHDLEAEAKNWITGHRNWKFCVYKNDYFQSEKMGGHTQHN
jgi:3-methyladenine DNA glycosylase AlkC